MSGIASMGRDVADWKVPTILIVGGLALGVLLVFHSKHVPHSLIDLSLLRIRTLRVNVSVGSFFRSGFGTATFILPLLFQVVFGMSAFASGLLTFVNALGSIGSRLIHHLDVDPLPVNQGCARYAIAMATGSRERLTQNHNIIESSRMQDASHSND
jgi:hypothetical protein